MALITAQAKRLRWTLAISGIVVFLAGTASCQAAIRTTYVCLGSAFRCEVSETPAWATAFGWVGAVGGVLLLVLAVVTQSPQEEKDEAEFHEAYTRRGREVIAEVLKRDGGACRTCGVTTGTDVAYARRPPP